METSDARLGIGAPVHPRSNRRICPGWELRVLRSLRPVRGHGRRGPDPVRARWPHPRSARPGRHREHLGGLDRVRLERPHGTSLARRRSRRPVVGLGDPAFVRVRSVDSSGRRRRLRLRELQRGSDYGCLRTNPRPERVPSLEQHPGAHVRGSILSNVQAHPPDGQAILASKLDDASSPKPAVSVNRSMHYGSHGDARRFVGGISVTCSRSVDPSIERVEEVPPEMTWLTSSKYSVPTNAWCSIARYPTSRAANSSS